MTIDAQVTCGAGRPRRPRIRRTRGVLRQALLPAARPVRRAARISNTSHMQAARPIVPRCLGLVVEMVGVPPMSSDHSIETARTRCSDHCLRHRRYGLDRPAAGSFRDSRRKAVVGEQAIENHYKPGVRGATANNTASYRRQVDEEPP